MELLIRDYTNCKRDDLSDVQLRIVSLRELLDELQRVRGDTSHKIAVYAIEECLLDWS